MMMPVLPPHIAGNAFCFISTVLIAYQVIRHPNKLRLFILGYSMITLPASIINTVQLENLVSVRCNVLVYLVSTLVMSVTHFFMMLDVGYRLRVGEEGNHWRHPLVLIGMLFVTGTSVFLVVQIVIFALNADGQQDHPLKTCFIGGVVCAIVGDCAVFTFTFKPLIYWRKNRTNEGYSRTTALGIWFFLVQNVWYTLYGAVYVWFFVMNSWEYFQSLLAIDYVMRSVENLLYTWSPPKPVIDYLSSKLPSTSVNLSTRKPTAAGHGMSSERYNKEEQIDYKGDIENPSSEDQRSTNGSIHDYDSRVTIVTRS